MVISFSFTTQSFAITLLEKPYTHTSGEPSQVNLNFDKLYNINKLMNGKLKSQFVILKYRLLIRMHS